MTQGETAGAYRWITEAARLLKAVKVNAHSIECGDLGGKNWFDLADELLSAVPCPQVDLGFNSPADRDSALSPWTKASDRLPTAEDAGQAGGVLTWLLNISSQPTIRHWKEVVRAQTDKEDPWPDGELLWMRAPAGPATKEKP